MLALPTRRFCQPSGKRTVVTEHEQHAVLCRDHVAIRKTSLQTNSRCLALTLSATVANPNSVYVYKSRLRQLTQRCVPHYLSSLWGYDYNCEWRVGAAGSRTGCSVAAGRERVV